MNCRLALLCLGFAVAAATPAALLQPLAVPAGATSATVTGISGDGSTIIGYAAINGTFQSVRWRSPQNPEVLLPIGVSTGNFARGVNVDGTVIVGTGIPNGSYGYRWVEGVGGNELTRVIQGASGQAVSTSAQAVSGDGRVVVGDSNTLTYGIQATQWVGRNAGQNLPDVPTGNAFGIAYGTNWDGTVSAGRGTTTAGNEFVRWVNGVPQLIGDLPGGPTTAWAHAVSYDGNTVVGRGWDANSNTAVRWTAATGLVPLGNSLIGEIGFNSTAFGVSANGSVIAGAAGTLAFVWTEQTGMKTLRERLMIEGIDVSAWPSIGQPAYVSADGCTFAGNGIVNGTITGFIAKLDHNANPGLVRGQVLLEDWTQPVLGMPIAVAIYEDGTLVEEIPTTLDGNGRFRVMIGPRGDFTVGVKAAHWLRRMDPTVFSYNGAADIYVELRNGDVDGDNEVGSADLSELSLGFLLAEGDPGFNPNADLDGDGEIGSSDLSVLSLNFLDSGD